MLESPQNSYVEIPAPNMMCEKVWPLGGNEVMSVEPTCLERISAIIKDTSENVSALHPVRIQGEDGLLQTRGRGSPRTQPW